MIQDYDFDVSFRCVTRLVRTTGASCEKERETDFVVAFTAGQSNSTRKVFRQGVS